MSRIQRIVGFDCGEDTHSAVLLDTAGKFCRKSEVTNELRPAAPEGAGVSGLGASRTGSRAGVRAPNLPALDLCLSPPAPRDVGVPQQFVGRIAAARRTRRLIIAADEPQLPLRSFNPELSWPRLRR